MKTKKQKVLKAQIKENLLGQMNQLSLKMAELSTDENDDIEWLRIHHQYQKCANMLEQLEDDKWRANPDTLLIVAGNLAGILLILNFEKAEILTSRAIQFVLKARV